MTTPVLATVERVGLATVQDAGRPDATTIGVPRSGAWHRGRYRVATALVDRAPLPTTPAVELLAGELVLRARAGTAAAVTGPARAWVNEASAPGGTAVGLVVDDVLTVHHDGPGPAYVALAGWREPLVLGSASTDTFSRLGGRVLAAGDDLSGFGGTAEVGSFARPLPEPPRALRVVAVAEGSDAPAPGRDPEWIVSSTARSGTRLVDAPAAGDGAGASRPMVVGAIQVTPAGEAIILGPDGGLTGGYPVIGVVITADLDRVSGLVPQERVRLEFVPVEQAAAAYDAYDRALLRCIVRPDGIG